MEITFWQLFVWGLAFIGVIGAIMIISSPIWITLLIIGNVKKAMEEKRRQDVEKAKSGQP